MKFSPLTSSCFLLLVLFTAQCSNAESTDPELVGTWKTKTVLDGRKWTFTYVISKSDHYRFTSITTDGKVRAKNGQWSLRSPTGFSDKGTYTFSGSDSVAITGKLGTAVWERVEKGETSRGSRVDPALIGTWKMDAPITGKQWTFTWVIRGAGSYTLSVVTEDGTYEAFNGQWKSVSASGITEEGTYTFNDKDSVSITGPKGTGVWTRVASAPIPSPKKDVLPMNKAKRHFDKGTAADAPEGQPINLNLSPLSSPAIADYRAGKYQDALKKIRGVVNTKQNDMVARFMYGAALKKTGNCEEARDQLSVVISWNPNIVQLYTTRATCAAIMGNALRAEADLAIAKQLDPRDKLGFRKEAEQEVHEALKDRPSESAHDLRNRLITQAKKSAPFNEQLVTANALLKVSNAKRLRGNETYSDRRRQLSWYLAESPKDAARLAKYGRFMLEELVVDSHWIESRGYLYSYRIQGKTLRQTEINTAKQYFQQALKSDPHHVLALVGLARISYQNLMYADAENYLKRAMASGEPDAEVLYMMRNVSAIASGQNLARSMALSQIKHWTERYGNKVYEYTQYPSQADLAQARRHDAQASRLLYLSKDYRKKVLAMRSDDARTHDYIGTLAYQMKDYQAAKKAYQRAIELDPENMDYHTALANAYARLKDIEGFLKQASYARNKIHTTAGTRLHWAWGLIEKSEWEGATKILEEAMESDPGASLPFAYLGIIAEGQGDVKIAMAHYNAAIIMEEAHGRQRGVSYGSGQGNLLVSRLSRTVALRTRMALLVEKTNPAYAQRLYLANIKLEQSLGDPALREKAFLATLPQPRADRKRRPRAPVFGELMRTNRAFVAYQLYQEGKHSEAVKHFKALRQYDKRMKSGGARNYEYLRDTVWLSKPIVTAALDTFKRVGDNSEIRWWERKAHGYFPPTNDWRRNTPRVDPRSYSRGGGKG